MSELADGFVDVCTVGPVAGDKVGSALENEEDAAASEGGFADTVAFACLVEVQSEDGHRVEPENMPEAETVAQYKLLDSANFVVVQQVESVVECWE